MWSSLPSRSTRLVERAPTKSRQIPPNPSSPPPTRRTASPSLEPPAPPTQVMQAGKKNRSVGSTLMNQESSRSHSIFTVVCECQTTRSNGDVNLTAGKLNLVDLAGSERQSKVGRARVLGRVLLLSACARARARGRTRARAQTAQPLSTHSNIRSSRCCADRRDGRPAEGGDQD